MKELLARALEAYAKFTPAQMIASAVLAVALAGGVPMTILAWAAVHTTQRTEDTQDSVTDLSSTLDAKLTGMRAGIDGQLSAIGSDVRDLKNEIAGLRTDVSSVNARTAGHEARLLALESQRGSFVSSDGFRSEVHRLDQRIDEVRRDLPGRRRERDDGDDAGDGR